MSRNARSKLMNMPFHLVVTKFNFLNFLKRKRFLPFLKRQTNLKSMFDALSVKLCENEEILDGTPKRK